MTAPKIGSTWQHYKQAGVHQGKYRVWNYASLKKVPQVLYFPTSLGLDAIERHSQYCRNADNSDQILEIVPTGDGLELVPYKGKEVINPLLWTRSTEEFLGQTDDGTQRFIEIND